MYRDAAHTGACSTDRGPNPRLRLRVMPPAELANWPNWPKRPDPNPSPQPFALTLRPNPGPGLNRTPDRHPNRDLNRDPNPNRDRSPNSDPNRHRDPIRNPGLELGARGIQLGSSLGLQPHASLCPPPGLTPDPDPGRGAGQW